MRGRIADAHGAGWRPGGGNAVSIHAASHVARGFLPHDARRVVPTKEIAYASLRLAT